ncbi:unnamed protein product [Rotaria magnacalcarata]|uniref:Uncharacterized protein n=1 Tax=Rotaria magnacalcarata TaxID=392030 RepID=A0A814YL76_9BILA|nr:unnamed protein product [Rotaria magnacalcarata]CAF5153339.1 unnamed protein product [Rotaria magnacalcarata]CAF5207975.1 unnamed protein product [Rotaria magnacalcarata]
MVDCRDCFGTLQEPTDPVYKETHPKCSRAELDEAGYEPTICPDPNYPTDENGYYKDPYPQRQRAPPTPECKTGTIDRKVKFIYLKPSSPEPSGVSFIQTHILLLFLLNLISSILLITATHRH